MPEPEDIMDMDLESVDVDSEYAPSQATIDAVGNMSPPSQEQGAEHVTDLETVEQDPVRKEMAPRSEMWLHFIKIKDEKGF